MERDISTRTGARLRRRPRRPLLKLMLVGVLALPVVASAVPSPKTDATAATTSSTMVCTSPASGSGVSGDPKVFNLRSRAGTIVTPDGGTITMWGFTPGTKFQMPGPILCVNEGDEVQVNLTNVLAEPVSIVFPGIEGVIPSGGTPGLLTSEAPGSGGTVSYMFTATDPGTFLYESGSEPSKQVQMGLYGAVVVRPAMGADYAYNDPDTRFDPDREFILILHDIDPTLHRRVARGRPYDVTTMHDEYWTINGRAFPDTISGNAVPWLPNQPYGALLQIEPYDSVDNPLPALVRYVNAGMVNHPMHPHGNNFRLIARDGRQLAGPSAQDQTYETFTTLLGAGQTADELLTWENLDNYSSSNPIGIKIPGLKNLVFKDGVTWYSGSPYLGEQGQLPVGVESYSQCGEFYYPIHSHALNEFQNADEGFGGLATLLRVDPLGGCPA